MIYILGFLGLLFVAATVWLVVRVTNNTDQYLYSETDEDID